MSARRAIQAAGDAANCNAADGPAIILFTGREPADAPLPSAAPVPARRGVAAAFHSIAIRLAQRVASWHERARDRRALASLDGRLRKDIGVTEADVWRELNKPFWRE